MAVARKRCWNKDWVLDLDVRAFFDSVPHDLLMRAVAHHTDERWVLLYIERWLKAPMTMRDGTTAPRERGTPQGSPISPLLANLFMHYAFDKWMDREHPGCPFERYADDVVVHCDTEQQARQLCAGLVERLGSLGLELHPDKTKIVYCKDTNRRDEAEHTSFDFLGYTFRGRLARGRRGFFVSFSPAMSPKAKQAIGEQIRDWHLNRRSATDLAGLAQAINARIRGWFNYYGAFYRSELYAIAARIDEHLVRWAMQKFKRLRGQPTKAWRWLDAARQREQHLLASKLAGLVKPWAVRNPQDLEQDLFVPSMRPLEARSVWCQARISSDHAMKVSTWCRGTRAALRSDRGRRTVRGPPGSVVVGEVEAVELL